MLTWHFSYCTSTYVHDWCLCVSVPGVISDLKVQRSEDNKQVIAQWGSVETTPPVGMVARYEIEYRDSEKGSVSTVFHSPRFNYLVVTNVINANSYEVGTRVCDLGVWSCDLMCGHVTWRWVSCDLEVWLCDPEVGVT